MTPLVASLLEMDRLLLAAANVCGQSARGKEIKECAKAVRRAAAPLLLADLVHNPDQVAPIDAVTMAAERALIAGIDFSTIAGALNRVNEDRLGTSN